MYVGHPTLCFKVADVAESKRFYQALGLELIRDAHNCALLRRGSFVLFLHEWGQSSINFRRVDPFAIHAHLRAEGIESDGQPHAYGKEQYDADADGACWMTHDPDGNGIFFDSHQREITPEARRDQLIELLNATEQDLIDLAASDECLAAFREHVLSKFTNDDPASKNT